MSTLTRLDGASKRGYEQATSDGAVLLDALTNLWEQTRHQGETSKRRAIETYAARLASFHPASVLRVLKDWPNHDDWWPALHALLDKLPPEGWEPERRALPPPPQRERLYERMKRLELTLMFAEIGVQRWKRLIDEHHVMGDEQIIGEVERLYARAR